MRNKFFLRILCLFAVLTMLISVCSREPLADLKIEYGIASIEGKITGSVPFELKDPISFTLFFNNPVTGNTDEYETILNKDGTFYFQLPVFCSGIGYIRSKIHSGLVGLVSGEKTKLEIFFDESGEKQINVESCIGFTSDDMQNISKIIMEIFRYPVTYDSTNHPLEMQPDTFSRFVINYMENNIGNLINTNTELSENAKQYACRYSKLYYLQSDLIDYDRTMKFAYYNGYPEKKDNQEDFAPINPDKSYYSFLEYFDLNNQQYLYPYCEGYSKVLQSILNNKILAIPRIENRPVSNWLEEVKATMVKLTGLDAGLFYDLLIVQAYAKQIIEENRLLSDTQKENIKNYFRDKSFANMLLVENERIIETSRNNQKIKNETPAVEKEVLMDAIVSKYKGKVVLVDFWATWCGPCLEAIYEFKEIKHELERKGVVFVYITDTSSPKGIWEKKIPEMKGEHYYLTEEESKYIHRKFGFISIPSYVLYDTGGELKNKVVGFPGIKEMQGMVEKLLP